MTVDRLSNPTLNLAYTWFYCWQPLGACQQWSRTFRFHPKRLTIRWSDPNCYIPKIILMSSQCGTICSTQILTILPRTKSLPASSTCFTIEDQMIDRDPTLYCVGEDHAFCEATTAAGHSFTPRGKNMPIANEHHCQIYHESFTGAHYCAFLHQIGESNNIEHHPHTRLSLGHDFDTNSTENRFCSNEPNRLSYMNLFISIDMENNGLQLLLSSTNVVSNWV